MSYDDINALALPVLRHRVKLTYDAIMQKRTPDDVILALIDELNGRKKARQADPAQTADKRAFRRV